MADDAVGETGISPDELVARVEGSLSVRFVPVHDAVDPGSAFEALITVEVVEREPATEEIYDGSGSGGAEDCPEGPVLYMPASARLTLDIGGTAEGRAELVAMGPGEAQQRIWFEGGVLDGRPAWLDEVAASVASGELESTPWLRITREPNADETAYLPWSGAIYLGYTSQPDLYRFEGVLSDGS